MKIKLALFPVIYFICLLASACHVCTQTGTSSEVRQLADFNSISVSSSVEAVLEKAGSPSVKIVAKGIDLKHVLTEVTGGKLKISLQKSSKYCNFKVTAFVSYASSLKEIEASSSSEVRGTAIKSSDLEISASSSAEISLTGVETNTLEISASSSAEVSATGVETNTLMLLASSSSELNITGKSEKTTIEASSSSEVEGRNLLSVSAEVSTSSSAEVNLAVEKELAAKATSSASIRYKGDPAKIISNTSSSGSIKKL